MEKLKLNVHIAFAIRYQVWEAFVKVSIAAGSPAFWDIKLGPRNLANKSVPHTMSIFAEK